MVEEMLGRQALLNIPLFPIRVATGRVDMYVRTGALPLSLTGTEPSNTAIVLRCPWQTCSVFRELGRGARY